MKLSDNIKPISYLKTHAAEVIRNLSEVNEPLIITQNGEAKLVVQDVKSYEKQQEAFALLKVLAMGNKQIEDGEFVPADEAFKAIKDDK